MSQQKIKFNLKPLCLNISWSCPINQNILMNVFSSYNNSRMNQCTSCKKIATKINYPIPNINSYRTLAPSILGNSSPKVFPVLSSVLPSWKSSFSLNFQTPALKCPSLSVFLYATASFSSFKTCQTDLHCNFRTDSRLFSCPLQFVKMTIRRVRLLFSGGWPGACARIIFSLWRHIVGDCMNLGPESVLIKYLLSRSLFSSRPSTLSTATYSLSKNLSSFRVLFTCWTSAFRTMLGLELSFRFLCFLSFGYNCETQKLTLLSLTSLLWTQLISIRTLLALLKYFTGWSIRIFLSVTRKQGPFS